MSFFTELKRRNVFRVAVAYLAGAWLLVEVTDTLFSIYGLPDTAARIVVTLLAIGFPITLVLSWVFELTPEGLKLEKDIDRTVPVARTGTRRLDRAIIVLLALALGYFAFDKFVLDPSQDQRIAETARQEGRSEALVESYGDKSIAVLPFADMSPEGDQEYFSDGISEELLNLLAQIPKLRVISRSSAFSFKGKDISIPEVARQLNVAHILEGSVRKAGDRVRITAQLIEARSDTHLWSQAYDRTLDDIFAVQDEIAAAISAALELELALTGAEAAQPTAIKTASAAAYDAYLQGRELIRPRIREDMEEAIKHLERAVRLDDSFAPAHAQLAIATMFQTSLASTDRVEARRKAIRHLDRAQALEPDLAEAHAGRTLLALYADNPEAVIEHARKALAVNPNYIDVMAWLREALVRLGRYEEAHAILEQMLVTDPLSITARRDYADSLMHRGRTREAHEIADSLIAQSPKAGYRMHAAISLWAEGKLADSLFWGLRASPDSWYASSAFSVVGEPDEARRINSDYWIDANDGRWEEAILASQRKAQLYPDSGPWNAEAAEVLYRARRLDEALPFYERALALAPEGLAVRGGFGPYFTIQLALLQRKAGDMESAQATAQIARQEQAARREAGDIGAVRFQTEALIAAFDQQPDRAIAALESALENGFRWLLFLEDPLFDELQQEPRFVALREELHVLLAMEHEKILQLVCFNNPVPDEWQPMPETCEDVVEQPEIYPGTPEN